MLPFGSTLVDPVEQDLYHRRRLPAFQRLLRSFNSSFTVFSVQMHETFKLDQS